MGGEGQLRNDSIRVVNAPSCGIRPAGERQSPPGRSVSCAEVDCWRSFSRPPAPLPLLSLSRPPAATPSALAIAPFYRTKFGPMAAGSRSRKTEVDAASLSNVDRLILCQAVYEHGSNAWPEVATVLSAHPMISRPKLFTAQVSSTHFVVVA